MQANAKFQLIIISGPPATGKTTIGQRIAAELSWPFLYKDGIKEILFDTVGYSDREWSKKLSDTTYELLFYCLETHLQGRHSLIIEGNFRAEHSARFGILKARYGFEPFQLQCYAEGTVLYDRYRQRWEAGQRHPGHVDPQTYDEIKTSLLKGRAKLLDIGGTIYELDTTDFDKIDYPAIVEAISEKNNVYFS